MRSAYTGHIVPAEWRWIIIVSSIFVLLAFMPFILVTARHTTDSGWEFMGAIHHYQDGAAYLSKIEQGIQGDWLVHFQHTPEPHDGILIYLIYSIMGQIAGVTSVSPMVMFHVVRVAASFFMYMAFYQLGASIWVRVRTRRIFFVMVSTASGLGWFFGSLTGDTSFIDLSAPQAFPFYSTIVNPHLPLALASIALLTAVSITVMRPGEITRPGVHNDGVVVFFLSIILILLYPSAMVPFSIAWVGTLVANGIKQRQIMPEVRWGMWIIIPSLPIAAYYFVIMRNNAVVQEWINQLTTPPVSPLMILLGLGISLVLATPGLLRAIRRFEQDGDRFMLLWLIAQLVLVCLPIMIRQQFLMGLMIPLAYFITRSIEDYWFNLISGRWRYRMIVAALPLIAISNLYVLFVPITPFLTGEIAGAYGMVLEPDYVAAFQWLNSQTDANDVILTSPEVGVWTPVWTGARAVYGNPAETLEAVKKRAAVIDWYRTEDTFDCLGLLNGRYAFGRRYRVDFVIYGPKERVYGAGYCLGEVQLAATFGDVEVYTNQVLRERP